MPIDNTKYAFALARAVDLLRKSPEPGEPQKAALRALVSAAAERSATFRFYENALTIDGEAIATTDPRLEPLAQRLVEQNVAELVLARGADANELLALCTGLAQDPGFGRLKERLRDAGSTRVMLITHQPTDPGHRTPTVSGAFAKSKLDQAAMAEWNKFLDAGAAKATDRQVDLGMQATPAAGLDPNAPQGEKQIRFDGGPAGAAPPPTYVPGQFVPASRIVTPEPPKAQKPPEPEPPPAAATMTGTTPLGIALGQLQANPYGKDTLSKLTGVARYIEDAFIQDRAAEAMTACVTLIELEAKAPEASRGAYSVMIKRALGRSALAQAAPFLLEQRRKERAAIVLKRGGEDSVGLLVGLLGSAQSLGERMAYLEVLRGITTGVDRVLALLSRSEWQVVRNTAELAGEARLEEAVPYLARLTEHHDDRVRRSAIVALAKIGTAGVVEPLRSVLQTGAPELRALVVNSIGGGPQSRALTAPLAALAESEDNPDVIRACYKAIGRIGTAEARHVLEKVASQKVMFSRKGKVSRETAEEVLRTMGA